jgi:hypothetical protein
MRFDDLGPEQLGRALHLRHALLAPGGPHLGGEERLTPRANLPHEIARHLFGAAIHGRAVDHASAGIEKVTEHLAERRTRLHFGADIEGLPGAEPDDRQGFAGSGDGSPDHDSVHPKQTRVCARRKHGMRNRRKGWRVREQRGRPRPL